MLGNVWIHDTPLYDTIERIHSAAPAPDLFYADCDDFLKKVHRVATHDRVLVAKRSTNDESYFANKLYRWECGANTVVHVNSLNSVKRSTEYMNQLLNSLQQHESGLKIDLTKERAEYDVVLTERNKLLNILRMSDLATEKLIPRIFCPVRNDANYER